MKRLGVGIWMFVGLLALAPATAFAGRIRGLAAGTGLTCVTTWDLKTWCWGRNNAGQLGLGNTNEQLWPQRVTSMSTVVYVASRDENVCLYTFGTAAFCAGANNFGQIGDGTNIERHVFTQVQPSAAFGSAYWLTAGNTPCLNQPGAGIRCWGSNQFGAVGDGTTTDRWSRVPLAVDLGDVGDAFDSTGGSGHSCAVKRVTGGGELWCWGNNANNALGVGPSVGAYSSTPVQVTALGNVATGRFAVGVGQDHSCAFATGGLWCWGQNDHGQLGDGTTTPRGTPVRVTGLDGLGVTGLSVSPGGGFTCVNSFNEVYCWGRNDRGQLGDGTTTDRPSPVKLPLTGIAAEVSAGYDHACAIQGQSSDERFYCWGSNDHGQVGDGTRTDRHSPALISLTPAPASVPASGPAGVVLLALGLLGAVYSAARARSSASRRSSSPGV